MKVHHIGILSKEISKALSLYSKMGYVLDGDIKSDNIQKNRIAFLNKKILTFSQSSVEKRLATYLINESQRRKADSFPFNHNKTAEEINAGRASVYRALASLEKEGLISGGDKIITIIDQKGLERISK